jgi:hypothetical protein
MNRGLDAVFYPLLAADWTVPASGWTHSLVGNNGWRHAYREGRILFGCRARALTEPGQLCSPSCLRWSIHYPPALKASGIPRGPAGLEESVRSLHAASRIGEPIECSAWFQ